MVLSVTGLMKTSPGPLTPDGAAEPEEDDPLVLTDDLHRESERGQDREDHHSSDDLDDDHWCRSISSPSPRSKSPSAGMLIRIFAPDLEADTSGAEDLDSRGGSARSR